MTDQLEHLVPVREVPSGGCHGRAIAKGVPLSAAHVPGTAVLLGWPVLPWCPGRTHNTLNAGRRNIKVRCICPRARQLRSEFRARENRSRDERRAHDSGGPMRGRQVSVLETINTAAFLPQTTTSTDMPECRIQSLGGPLPDHLADNFHADERGTPSALMREEAKKVCRRCPLQRECLIAAVDRKEMWGIWGGLDPQERRSNRLVNKELDAIDSGERA